MAAGGHLVYKNVSILTRHIMGGAYMMQIAEHGANRIIRLEVIWFFVNFQLAPAAILDFEIRVFGWVSLLDMRSGWYLWSLIVLRSAVEKLLKFLFSVGNALEVPKIRVLGDFRGENWNMYLSEPKKAPPYAETRVLTYYSSKSVHNCDLWEFPRKKTDTDDVNVGVCWGRLWLADSNEIW